MLKPVLLILAGTITMMVGAHAAPAIGNAQRGAQLFQTCASCHSLVPDRNMTGPSLAGVWGRPAGSLGSFDRYSPAVKAAHVVWDESSLDAWLKSPSQFIPQNRMTFDGVSDARQRADLIAFLKKAGSPQATAANSGQNSGTDATTSAGDGQFADLKTFGPDRQVEAIRYCRDTYHVATANGKSADFWESNLRLKTDSSAAGPSAGKPVIMPAGMMGDRASVFFAAPDEISAFIKHQC